MFDRLSRLAAGAMVAIGLAAAAAPATLHRPLPADSTERNGEPQPLKSDPSPGGPPPPALPGGGLHPHAQAGLKRRYSGTPIDVLTYHYDNPRTGWNQSETDLTPTTVGSAAFGQLTTLNVDGKVFAQPLLVSNFTMPDGSTHDVLIVVTAHDSVYAFDAATYQTLWQVSLGVSQSNTDVGCKNNPPEYGISSTPVIVRSGQNAATIYLVAATEPTAFSFHTQVHALDLGTGADLAPPRPRSPPARRCRAAARSNSIHKISGIELASVTPTGRSISASGPIAITPRPRRPAGCCNMTPNSIWRMRSIP